MAKKPASIYQIKVTLDGSRPPVWRRIQVSGNTTLLKLHHVLQVVMGWQDYHLHQFVIEDVTYADPAYDDWGDWGIEPEERYRLSQLVPGEGFRFHYEYDFGDGWGHTLLVEKIAPAEEGIHYPICLKGKRSCPPEDVGGVWGYESFLQAIGDPDHPEHDDYLAWVGGTFDPEAFDLEAVNAGLRRVKRGTGAGAWSAWPPEEDQPEENRVAAAAAWAQGLSEDQQAQTENLPLRRDLIALLTYLRENRVTGTQATGNLPLKAVCEISALFVDPPKLEDVIGDQVFRIRSEADVWSLYFRHVLAAVGGWAAGGPGRRWRLTPPGEHFLTMPAPLQVWLLLDAWWNQTNWAIASPFDIREGHFAARFRVLALNHLLDLPPGEPAPFVPFADRLVEDAGLVWPIENQDHARGILQAIVEHTVVNPLIDFGVLAADYRPHQVLGAKFRELSALQVTPLGKGLLHSLRQML
jgi:hypothetical protein